MGETRPSVFLSYPQTFASTSHFSMSDGFIDEASTVAVNWHALAVIFISYFTCYFPPECLGRMVSCLP